MMLYYNKIYNYIINYTTGDQSTIIKKQAPHKSKIDMKNLNEILLKEYAVKFPITVKQENEKRYLELTIAPKTLKRHTPEHHKVLEQVHLAALNIDKLVTEIGILNKDYAFIESTIKADLNLYHGE